MKTATEITVRRRVREEWFVYTCEQLPGLYVASQDDREAYDDVPEAIARLFELDHEATVSVWHKLSYDHFLASLSQTSEAVRAVADRTADLMGDGPEWIKFVIGSAEQRPTV